MNSDNQTHACTFQVKENVDAWITLMGVKIKWIDKSLAGENFSSRANRIITLLERTAKIIELKLRENRCHSAATVSRIQNLLHKLDVNNAHVLWAELCSSQEVIQMYCDRAVMY